LDLTWQSGPTRNYTTVPSWDFRSGRTRGGQLPAPGTRPRMREVIRAYQSAVAAEVARFEGHVAKFMGDGVLAYFWLPQGP
jgi:hypothetical protein